LGQSLISRVFKIGSEISQVLLLFIIVFLFNFPEFFLLGVKSTEYKSGMLAMKVVKNCLRNDLAYLDKIKAGLSQLTN
jgi:hypothetical protein